MSERITNRLIPIRKELTNLAVQLKPNKKVGVSDAGVTVQSKPKLKRKVSDAEKLKEWNQNQN